jgi:hypothetical protein
MPHQDPREQTLQGQQRMKILAKKIQHKQGDNPEEHFTHFSTDKLCDTTEGKSGSTTTITAQSVRGLIGYMQPAFLDLRTWRKSQT